MKRITILNREFRIEPKEIGSDFADIVESINDVSDCVCQLKELLFNKEPIKANGYPRSRVMFVAMNPSNKRELTGYRGDVIFEKRDIRHHSIVRGMLENAGLTFNNVYITNILKCSTTDNKLDHNLMPYCIAKKFVEELAFVDPDVIICMGGEVSKLFGISIGKWTNNGDYFVAGIHHPSFYANYAPNSKDYLHELDFISDKITEVKINDFVNLHVHNEFSIRDGIGTVDEHVLWALKNKSPACSITNHGNASVFFKQYEACKKVNLKPIFGAELYLINDREALIPWIKNTEEGAVEKRKELAGTRSHILLLAKNYEGLRNIFRISSKAFIESFFKFPLVDFNLIAQHKEGVIVSTACAGGELAQMIEHNKIDDAVEYILKYKKEFGENFYLELMSIDYPHQWDINQTLMQLSRELGVKVIVTTDAHYLYPEDTKVHEAVLLLKSKKSYKEKKVDEEKEEGEENIVHEEEKLWQFSVKDLYLKTAEMIAKNWEDGKWFGKETYFTLEDFAEVMLNTYDLYTKIEHFDLDRSIKIPKLYEDGETVLRDKIEHGFSVRPIPQDKLQEYLERCEKEYNTIVKLGFIDYFLILEDMIRWTKTTFGRNSVGPGRGSAGGSLINYLLEITDIDPIKHKLLFERFLDEGRKDMPDVDIDFTPEVRDSVKDYLTNKFGKDKVVSICNYQVAKVKTSIKDAARIYNVDFNEVNAITNALPFFLYVDGKKDVIDNMSYDYIVSHYPDVKVFFQKYPDVDRLFKRLRNSIKAIGRHAAGVVISSLTLYDWIPLVRAKDYIVTANTEGGDYHELTAQGFIKFDILGLNNLSVINDTMKLIKERHGTEIEWDNIDIEAPEAYELARNGDTFGVFQFESNLATKTALKVQPTCFDDLSAINAIIRPGPLDMGMHDEFAKRKREGSWEKQIHPSYAPLLKSTYGIIVYQENFMSIFREIGKFNVIEVNAARKDLVKYERSTKYETARLKRVDSWRDKFVVNAKTVMPEEDAVNLWELIRSFARYGFNKSHADAYTIISFRELWLKAHYGLEFYTALLNNTFRTKEDKEGTSIIAKYISHIQMNSIGGRKVAILPIDINKSGRDFQIERDDIRFGFLAVKGVGDDAAAEIMTKRPFASIDELITSDSKLLKNKRLIIALIKSGALDSIAEGRKRGDMYNYFIKKRNYKEDEVDWTIKDLISNEIEYSNMSFSEIAYFAKMRETVIQQSSKAVDINLLDDVLEMENGEERIALFRINKIEKRKTKSGKKYFVLSVSDGVSTVSRAYYWPHKQKKDSVLDCENKETVDNVYIGVFVRQNNFYTLKEAK